MNKSYQQVVDNYKKEGFGKILNPSDNCPATKLHVFLLWSMCSDVLICCNTFVNKTIFTLQTISYNYYRLLARFRFYQLFF